MSGIYRLQNKVLGGRFELEITRHELNELRDAKNLFSAVFSIEESFDLLLENFFALEHAAQTIVLRDMIQRNHSYGYFNTARATLTRHTINFLATFTAYLSVVRKAKLPSTNKRSPTQVILTTLSDNDECRLLEVVRNISQHRDLPVSGLTLGTAWTGPNGGRWQATDKEPYRSLYTVNFHLNADKIRSDRKSKVDPEILAGLERVNLPMLIRRALEAIGGAHVQFRELVSDDLARAQQATRGAIERYRDLAGAKPTNLHAISPDGSEEVLIIDEHFEYVSSLQEKNASFVNFSKRVASSHVDDWR